MAHDKKLPGGKTRQRLFNLLNIFEDFEGVVACMLSDSQSNGLNGIPV